MSERFIMSASKSLSHKIVMNEPLRRYSSIGIGGRALNFINVSSTDEIISSLEYAAEEGLELFVLGKGTNLLISDYGVDGLVMKLGGDEFY